jgi:hypothetical protein
MRRDLPDFLFNISTKKEKITKTLLNRRNLKSEASGVMYFRSLGSSRPDQCPIAFHDGAADHRRLTPGMVGHAMSLCLSPITDELLEIQPDEEQSPHSDCS